MCLLCGGMVCTYLSGYVADNITRQIGGHVDLYLVYLY
jgi:hypothetical protein